MDLVCSDPHITPDEADAILRSVPVAGGIPVFGLAGNGVLFASRTMLNLFQVHDLDGLTARLGGSDPGAKRIGELATALPVDGANRLERLRFSLPPATETLTVLCRRLSRTPDPVFVLAALNARPALLRPPPGAPVPPPAVSPPAPPPPAVPPPPVPPAAAVPELPPAAQSTAEPSPPPVSATPPAAPVAGVAAAEPASAETTRGVLARRPGPRRVRFLWRTDAGHTLTDVTPQLGEIVGGVAAAIVGRSLAEVAQAFALDPTGNLDRALERRESWSGLQVAWPITNAAAKAPVALGALPSFDAEQRFEGYHGYGVIDIDRVSPAEAICRDPIPAVAPEPEPEPAPPQQGANVVQLRPSLQKPAAAAALSDSERSAFDQIASLLTGAEAEDVLDGSGQPGDGDAAARGAEALLGALDAGVLVARDGAILAASKGAFALTGHADLAGLQGAGGLGGLFEALPGPETAQTGLRTATGSEVRVRTRTQPLDWGGAPAELVTFQAAEEPRPPAVPASLLARQEAETRELKTILDTATDGVVVLDGAGRMLSLNRAGEALFGCDQTEVLGAPFTDLIAPEAQARVRDYLEGLKTEGVASLLNDGREIIGRTRQGGLIPLFVTLGRMSPDGDGPVKFCALLRDMTQWKKVERELNAARQEAERASALKSDFLAKVSHEIRTPLNAIIGFAEVIMDERFGPVGNERYRDYLKDIHASGQHVMSLVNDLLDLSKIEAGKMELTIGPVDANQVIADCVSIMQPQASRERVIMRLSLARNLPQIMADARSLKQIVLNLLSNAVKFNEPGGQVIVATTLTDTGHAVIRVRDTGIGMSDEDIEVALEPFRQVATTRATSGTGLGLPLTKALVEANSAYFEIKSRPKEGTLVEIVFPPAQVLARGEARS